MSQAEVERFLGRLLTDAGFRSRATRSVMAVSCKEGFTLSISEVSFLKQMDFSQLDLVAEHIDDCVLRA